MKTSPTLRTPPRSLQNLDRAHKHFKHIETIEESTKTRTLRNSSNPGYLLAPCPIAPREEISRAGEPLTPIYLTFWSN